MSKKPEKEKKGKNKGIQVISGPLNFKHRVHVGADSVNIEELQALFENAGKTIDNPNTPNATGKADISNKPNKPVKDKKAKGELPKSPNKPAKGELPKSQNKPAKGGSPKSPNKPAKGELPNAPNIPFALELNGEGNENILGNGNTMKNFTPPKPCRSRNISGEDEFQSDGLLELLKVELVPILRFELDRLLEDKFATWFHRLTDHTSQAPLQHCKTHCKCRTLNINFSDTDDGPLVCGPGIVNGVNGGPAGYNGSRTRYTSSTDSSPRTSPAPEIDRNDRILHNPIYPVEIERHVIPQRGPTNGFDMQRPANNKNSQENPTNKVDSKGKQTQKTKESPLLPEYRDCLAKSIQENMSAVVEGLEQGQDQLHDIMLSDGCITKDERDDVNKLKHPKDRTRAAIVLVKDKDILVLDRFLKRLQARYSTLHRKVMETYERHKKDGYRIKQCMLCRLMCRVNVKYTVDMLWSAGIIDDDLFHQVRVSTLPGGAQGPLWQQMIKAINSYISLNKLKVMSTLSESLCRYHHYDDLARALETFLESSDGLHCCCVHTPSDNIPNYPQLPNVHSPSNMDLQPPPYVAHPKMGLSDKTREPTPNKPQLDGQQQRKDARIYINTCDQPILPDKPVIVDSTKPSLPKPERAKLNKSNSDESENKSESKSKGSNSNIDITRDSNSNIANNPESSSFLNDLSATITEGQRMSTLGRVARTCVSLEDLTSVGVNKGDNSYDTRNSDGAPSQRNCSLDNLLVEQGVFKHSDVFGVRGSENRPKKPVPLKRLTKVGNKELQASYV